jgi:hypothetical protein
VAVIGREETQEKLFFHQGPIWWWQQNIETMTRGYFLLGMD